MKGHRVKASTTSENRLSELTSNKAEPFLLDIGKLPLNIHSFLQTNVLIINIPSKDINAFGNLVEEIEKSEIENILFISSTSVYENKNKIVSEPDGEESTQHHLITIENIFRGINRIKTSIIRFGGLIGYSRNPGIFFSKGKIVQNPDSHVNLIHRDDCIEIINQIIEQEVWGKIFNCCADSHPTKREFYTHTAKSIGFPSPNFANSGTNSFKIISNQKVKETLGYTFLHPDLMKIEFEKYPQPKD